MAYMPRLQNANFPLSMGNAKALDSSRAYEGNAPTSYTNGVRDRTNIADNLRNFFGVAKATTRDAWVNHERYEGSAYQVEKQEYPDAFNALYGGDGQGASNDHMSNVLIEKVLAHQAWAITRMAPVTLREGPLFGVVSVAVFTKHMLDKLPEYAIPRMTSRKQRRSEVSTQRHGICMMLEATFAETPLGRQTYLMQIEQLKVACVETACYGAVVAVLEHVPYHDAPTTNTFPNSGQRNAQQLNALFMEEKNAFALVHKDPRGYMMGVGKLRGILRRRTNGETQGDLLINPYGMAKYMQDCKEDTRNYISGPGTDEELATMSSLVVESRMFGQEGEDQHDPFFKPTTTGDFMVLNDLEAMKGPIADYRTSMMDSYGFSMDEDAYIYLAYAKLYKYAGIWDYSREGAPVTDTIGKSFFTDAEVYTWRQLYLHRSSQHSGGDQFRFDAAVDKIHMLPPEKRTAFWRSLRLIPKNDMESMTGEFSWSQFDSMCNGEISLVPASTAADIQAVQDYEQSAMSRADIHDSAFHRTRKRMRQAQEANSQQVTLEQLYDANSDADEVDEQMPETTYVSEDGRYVSRIDSHTRVTRRIVRAKRKSAAAPIEGELTRTFESLQHLLDSLCDKADEDASTRRVLFDAIKGKRGITDATKLALAREYLRVAKGVLTTPVDEQKEAEMLGHMARFTAPYELPAALAAISASHYTPLEKAAVERGNHMHTFSMDVMMPGWWRPDASDEDGQLKLPVAGVATQATTVPLDSDAFAITLAEGHQVLFDWQDADDPNPLILPYRRDASSITNLTTSRIHRSRVNRLVWSAAISKIIHRISTCNSKDHARQLIDDETMARIITFVKNQDPQALISTPVLMSQVMYGMAIAAAAELLVLLANEWTGFIRDEDGNVQDARTFDAIKEDIVSAMEQIDTIHKSAKSAFEQTQYISPEKKTRRRQAASGSRDLVQTEAPSDNTWSKVAIADALGRASLASALFMQFAVENDIPVPLAIELYRPHKTMMMGCRVLMKSGENGAARTFVAKPHFMCSANASHKIIFCNLSVYMGTAIMQPNLIVVQPNVFCQGYIGGWGKEVYDPNNVNDVQEWMNQTDTGQCMFAIHTLQHRSDRANDLSFRTVTGLLPSSLGANDTVADMLAYEGCEGIARHWRIHTDKVQYLSKDKYSIAIDDTQRAHNVICFQGFQRRWDHSTKKYTLIEENKDHWGPNACYPGARAVLDGHATHFEIPSYRSFNSVKLN